MRGTFELRILVPWPSSLSIKSMALNGSDVIVANKTEHPRRLRWKNGHQVIKFVKLTSNSALRAFAGILIAIRVCVLRYPGVALCKRANRPTKRA